jgi:peptidoglycan/LPS O-acetylase OafA/YrhL
MPASDQLMTAPAPERRGATAKRRERGAARGSRADKIGAGFRPDIEGLRAVAIGLVLLYHGGVEQLTGGFVGVDVFFVISGFLITGLLIRELEKTGRISLPRFYARRAKRLLPATALVLVVTAILTWLTISVIDWGTFGADIITAALYVVNWQLAARSVDYLAEDVGVSPVQHFWSLAVEEQFYIVWPLLLVVVAWWVRRRSGARLRAVMTVGILLITIPSLAYSIYLTGANQAAAFFVTPTRLWEMGIGAFVAIGANVWPRLNRTTAAILGWAGLAAIAVSALIFAENAFWPGHLALVPTLGTAAVIVAGFASGKAGPAVLLSWRPAVWVGGLSYSLYLWHWPLIICATAYWGELGTKKGLLVMAAAFIPAYLSYRFIENPVRFAPTLSKSDGLTLSIGANCTLIGVIVGLVLALAVPTTTTTAPADSQQALGAAVLRDGAPPTTGGDGTVESLAGVDWWTPEATAAPEDIPVLYEEGCQATVTDTELEVCEYGDPDGDYVVVVVGDSKILQWGSPLIEIAEEQGWRMHFITKSGCPFADAARPLEGELYTTCLDWNDAAVDELAALSPDLVITSQRHGRALEDPDDVESLSMNAMVQGLVARWSSLTEDGIGIAVVLDNPSPGGDVYECVAENSNDLAQCTFPRERAVESSGAPAQLAAAARVPGVTVIDLTDLLCPAENCVPVIGNVLIYRQGSHITDTYTRSLTDVLSQQLVAVANGQGPPATGAQNPTDARAPRQSSRTPDRRGSCARGCLPRAATGLSQASRAWSRGRPRHRTPTTAVRTRTQPGARCLRTRRNPWSASRATPARGSGGRRGRLHDPAVGVGVRDDRRGGGLARAVSHEVVLRLRFQRQRARRRL